MFALFAAMGYSLFRYIDRSNLGLSRFLQSVRYHDFSLSPGIEGLGGSFADLNSTFREISGQFQRDQLAHLVVRESASRKQTELSAEVVAVHIDQHVRVRHENLVLKNKAVSVARGRKELVVVGADALGCGHGVKVLSA